MFVKTFILTCLTVLFYQGRIQMADCDTAFTQNQSSGIAVLPYDPVQHWMLPRGQAAGLSASDMEIIEASLVKCIQRYNAGIRQRIWDSNKLDEDLLIDLSQYKRQYVAVALKNGDREVWVNCFCDPLGIDWTRETVWVDDGGKCFFNLIVRLPGGEYRDFEVNGEA